MSQGRAQQSAPDRPPHNCLDGFISAIFTSYRQVATAEPRTRHGQMPKSQWKRRDLWTRGRATLAPTSIPKCKGFCTPRRLALGGMGAASRASVSAPSVPQGGAVKAVSPRLRHSAMLSFFSLLNLQSAAVFVKTDTRQNGEPHPSSGCQLKIGCDPGNATRNAVRRPWIRRQERVPRRREGAASVQKNRYTCP